MKGPVDHVELAFVDEGRETYGFFILISTKTQKFEARTYDTIDKYYDVVWYLLPDIDRVACERYCESMHDRGTMSAVAMMRSAMPFENEEITKLFSGYVETRALPTDAFQTVGEPEFCASSVMKALQRGASDKLKDVDPYQITAYDVVRIAQERLGAVAKPRPEFVKNVDPEIVRSENWYN